VSDSTLKVIMLSVFLSGMSIGLIIADIIHSLKHQ